MSETESATKLPRAVVTAARGVALALRKDRTRGQLAPLVGTHETTFGKFVAGKSGLGPAAVMKLAALGGHKPEAVLAGRLVRAPRIPDTEGPHRARTALTGLYTEEVIDAAIRALEAVGATSLSPELLRYAASFVTDVRLASIDNDPAGWSDRSANQHHPKRSRLAGR